MKPTENCYSIIKHYESLRLRAYRDSTGKLTIGWGTVCYENGAPIKPTDIIPQFRAEQLMRFEAESKARTITMLTGKVKLNQDQFDALLSFTYNLGTGNLKTSTLLQRVLADPNDPYINTCFLMWVKAKNKNTGLLESLDGLIARRKSESLLYFTGVVRYFN